MTYSEKLKDPRWQKLRLKILERDEWRCQRCFDEESTLMVHHLIYEKGKEPWEASPDNLLTVCSVCHEVEHESRSYYEKELINQLKAKGFMAEDLNRIRIAFRDIPIINSHDYTADFIGFMFSDKNLIKYAHKEFSKKYGS
jgi:hypothetical protein